MKKLILISALFSSLTSFAEPSFGGMIYGSKLDCFDNITSNHYEIKVINARYPSVSIKVTTVAGIKQYSESQVNVELDSFGTFFRFANNYSEIYVPYIGGHEDPIWADVSDGQDLRALRCELSWKPETGHE